MKLFISKQNWFNGARIIAIIMFSYSIVEKLIRPTSFYTIVSSLNLHINAPEVFLSLIISIEMVMVYLLIYDPKKGTLLSALVLIFFTVLIGVLHSIGIKELCSDVDVLMKYLGPATILQNIGLSLLLFSSWMYSKELLAISDQ